MSDHEKHGEHEAGDDGHHGHGGRTKEEATSGPHREPSHNAHAGPEHDAHAGREFEGRPARREVPLRHEEAEEVESDASRYDLPVELLLSEQAGENGRSKRRVVDSFGDVLEVTVEGGEIVDERMVGSLSRMRVLQEQRRDGEIIRRVRDDSGRVVRQILDDVGRIMHLSLENGTEEEAQPASGERQEEPDATAAARDLARREGIDLSEVEGTGPRGKVLTRDVSWTLRRRATSGFRHEPHT